MPFNLIMKRKVFVKVQILCEEYEEKFNEKIATAKLVNVLLAEALINRGLIPKELIEKQYGCANPISQGFTNRDRNKGKSAYVVMKEQFDLEQKDNQFRGILEEWDYPRKNVKEWREKNFAFAEKYADKLQSAREILALKEASLDLS